MQDFINVIQVILCDVFMFSLFALGWGAMLRITYFSDAGITKKEDYILFATLIFIIIISSVFMKFPHQI